MGLGWKWKWKAQFVEVWISLRSVWSNQRKLNWAQVRPKSEIMRRNTKFPPFLTSTLNIGRWRNNRSRRTWSCRIPSPPPTLPHSHTPPAIFVPPLLTYPKWDNNQSTGATASCSSHGSNQANKSGTRSEYDSYRNEQIDQHGENKRSYRQWRRRIRSSDIHGLILRLPILCLFRDSCCCCELQLKEAAFQCEIAEVEWKN